MDFERINAVQLDGCKQLLEKGLKPLDNKLDVLVNNAGELHPSIQHIIEKVRR